ncbi:hypothetical protein BT63DRAFT_101477 [Microthyrium microscopicum]|uniref:Zn(2)-C6 fungal-type domain-containing protein n=1 Tax=Microthyrium microscopicum TaxID=703497 RepID=A0A6A6TWL2_9PEZI|nr:hypothetical protein BT63DRAFT_101477 [Microthyrium microscopicum]
MACESSPESTAFYGMKRKYEDELSTAADMDHWSLDESDIEERKVNRDQHRRKRMAKSRPMSVSCDTCKQRKVKCNRQKPSCAWCTKNGHVCEYKERKKPGLRAGYGRELEAKLAEQAVLLKQMRATIQRHETIIAQLTAANSFHASSPTLSVTSEETVYQMSMPNAQITQPETLLLLDKPLNFMDRTVFGNPFPAYPSPISPFMAYIDPFEQNLSPNELERSELSKMAPITPSISENSVYMLAKHS